MTKTKEIMFADQEKIAGFLNIEWHIVTIYITGKYQATCSCGGKHKRSPYAEDFNLFKRTHEASNPDLTTYDGMGKILERLIHKLATKIIFEGDILTGWECIIPIKDFEYIGAGPTAPLAVFNALLSLIEKEGN